MTPKIPGFIIIKHNLLSRYRGVGAREKDVL